MTRRICPRGISGCQMNVSNDVRDDNARPRAVNRLQPTSVALNKFLRLLS